MRLLLGESIVAAVLFTPLAAAATPLAAAAKDCGAGPLQLLLLGKSIVAGGDVDPLAAAVTSCGASPLWLLLLDKFIDAGGDVDPADVSSLGIVDDEILLRYLGGARFECFRGLA